MTVFRTSCPGSSAVSMIETVAFFGGARPAAIQAPNSNVSPGFISTSGVSCAPFSSMVLLDKPREFGLQLGPRF